MKNIIALLATLSLLPFGQADNFPAANIPAAERITFNKRPKTMSDLKINWGGVPDSMPMFSISNMLPGDTATRIVTLTNNADSPRPIGVKGVLLSPSDLTPALKMEITAGPKTVYSEMLPVFFSDSTDNTRTGINLVTINPHSSQKLAFKVTFSPEAGNNYKNTKTVFDITVGIFVVLPDECKNMKFDKVIFGTEKSENLTGGYGNNLILGMGGNDKIEGNKGDDCLIGGNGNDRIHGNNGNDVLIGGGGDNFLDGGNGNDVCRQGIQKNCEKSY